MPDLDYYTALNLSRSATENDIKKAYHKMALRWHPDKNQERKEEAEKKFKEISEAYQVLSDKEKRAVYDKYGKTGLTGVNASADRNAEQRAKREHSQSVPRSRPRTDFYGPSFVFTFRSPDEVFAEFFGGRDPFEDIFPEFGSFGEVFSQGSRVNDKRSVGHHGGRSTQQAPARHQSNSHQPRRRQPWDSDLIADFNDDFFKFASISNSWNGSFPASLSTSSGKNVRSSTTSTKTKNGKKIVTKRTRTVENGVETIIVEENGIVKSRDVRYSAQEL